MTKKANTPDKYTLETPFVGFSGAIHKGGAIFRQKTHTITVGDTTVTLRGKKEAYVIANPRDWKKNPAQGQELAHQTAWANACHQTKVELEDAERLKYWQQRFLAQTKKPEDGLTKSYVDFRAFVRTMILFGRTDL